MAIDGRLEGLYQQIQLVRGAGNPKRGQLCIMSFVAFLAGEGHTDDPKTASRLIRRFAMTINDGMPDHFRQRLKSFAPRLLGTRDGQDPVRAEFLLKAARTEVFPQIMEHFSCSLTDMEGLNRLCREHRLARPQDLVEQVVSAFSDRLRHPEACEQVASALAQLLLHCAKIAPPKLGEWYWLKAIELLDRLCEVGADQGRPELYPRRVASLEEFLNRRAEIQRRRARALVTLKRVRNLIPVLCVKCE